MKYTLADKDIAILEHVVFVAEKSAKTIQFCFRKGKHQTYINPKKELFVSFDLQTPIDFDYPIANLKTFLADDIKDLDPDKNNVDISKLSKGVFIIKMSTANKSTTTKLIKN